MRDLAAARDVRCGKATPLAICRPLWRSPHFSRGSFRDGQGRQELDRMVAVSCNRMHGGAQGSGGPKGARNGNYKRGRYTAEVIATRRLCVPKIRFCNIGGEVRQGQAVM
jgi:hypothetical protein